jgi:hypothetical protein
MLSPGSYLLSSSNKLHSSTTFYLLLPRSECDSSSIKRHMFKFNAAQMAPHGLLNPRYLVNTAAILSLFHCTQFGLL